MSALDIKQETGRRQFQNICSAPMAVRPDVMPRHTRVAKSPVDADFRMKPVSFGSIRLLTGEPFASNFKSRTQAMQSNSGNDPLAVISHRNSRKWLKPALFAFQQSKHGETIYPDQAQVRPAARAQQAASDGRLVDSSPNALHDKEFARVWTNRMDETLNAETVRQNMANIYRHFAIAEIIARHDAFSNSRLNACYLLDDHHVARIELPDAMSGYARFPERSDGQQRAFSVCGGVSPGFSDSTLAPDPESHHDLGDLAAKVISLIGRKT